jgi:glyoxylase I family protein
MPEFPSLHHVAVTVTNLDASRDWYNRLFDTAPALDENTGPWHHVVWALGNTLFGIHKHPSTDPKDKMSEFRPGLDHVSFGVPSRDELSKWEARLNELGLKHGGIQDAPYGSGLSFRDPDNNALELFAPPA